MDAVQVVPGLWSVKIRFVNAYLLDTGDGLALIDTGIPGSAPTIQQAVRSIGRGPAEIRHILVTHCHSDHSGSLAEMKRLTGAPAACIRSTPGAGGPDDAPLKPAPGCSTPSSAGCSRESRPRSGTRDRARGPGRRDPPGRPAGDPRPRPLRGQLAFLWPEHGGVLIAADAATHVVGLTLSPMYEDVDEGRRSPSKLAGLEFEVACFGHGKPIKSGVRGDSGRTGPRCSPLAYVPHILASARASRTASRAGPPAAPPARLFGPLLDRHRDPLRGPRLLQDRLRHLRPLAMPRPRRGQLRQMRPRPRRPPR